MKDFTFTFSEAEIAIVLEGLEGHICGLRDMVMDCKKDPDGDMVYGINLNFLKEAIALYERIGQQVGLEEWDYKRFSDLKEL